MYVELTERRLKEMAKRLRADLGDAAPSYQHTLDLLAKMLCYRSYEAMQPSLAKPTKTDPPGIAPRDTLAVLHIEPEERPDWGTSEPLILIARTRTAAEAALHAWLDSTTENRNVEDQPHRIEIRPVHDITNGETQLTAPVHDVIAVIVEEADRPDGERGRLVTLGATRRAAEAALQR
ncbi:hypothetical protein CKO28_00945 [Rhodovibrio sodomensis]|uniref:Uncharacterized protein n=1 Tax=Rhodovibrio sodomensis TaxID=1088 RepID=A0ABS1D867_9PROT|nr:hypothetical protein [Rhodovibrio sodomensis]MBK1666609.1 hypothetical protein [Rhodovibrio sodomensis]